MGKKLTYDIGFNVDKSGLKSAQQELEKISNMSFKDAKLINASLTKAEFDKIKDSAKELEQVLKNSFNEKLGTYNLKDLEKNIKSLKTPLDQTYNNIKKLRAEGVSAFRSMAAEVLTTNGNVRETSKLIESMGKTLGNTIKWSVASSVVNMFTSSVQRAWNYTQKLDESLNNIRIVTEKSNEEMEKFAKTANKAAKNLGSSTTSYTNAALIYYQQGLSDKDVQARTKTTIKAANVTGQSAAEVSEQLTAVWNGYKVVAQEAELYVDKLAAVAASTAADLEELSTGMSKVASAANAMGVDVDQLSAQLATIISVTRQDASVVGTALKTIYSRMGDLKVSGVDEFGISLGDVSGQLRQMGIEVLDQEGNLRDMGTVIEEVAAKWGTWTDAQQQAAAVAIAGKRQYNNLIALFENWDMYESSLTTSKTSEGTLQKQQEIHMDSLEAKLQELSTAAEKVWDNLIDTESTKVLIESLAKITGFLGDLVGGMGGLGGILLSVGGSLIKIFNGQIVNSVSRTVNNIRTSIRGLNEEAEKESLKNAFGSISEKGLQQMLKIKKDQLTYSKLLTTEEKKQSDNMITQTAQAYNQLDLAKKRKKELEDFYKKATGKTGDLYLANHAEAMGNNLEIHATGLTSLAKDISKTASSRDVLDNSYSDFRGKSISQLKRDQKKTSDPQLISDIQEMIELKALEGKVFQEVGKINQNALNKLKEANRQYVAGTLNSNEYTMILSNTLREVAKETEDFAKETRKGTQDIKDAQTEIDRLEKEYREMQEALKQRKLIENITSMIGVITSAIGVIQSLSNAIQVWQNESLSFGEKASQSIGMIATVAMAVVPVVIKSAAAIKAGVDVALNWISIALTVIAAVIGLVLSVIKAIPKQESALEKANNALKKAEENTKKAREEYSRFNSELEELKNTINDINIKKLEFENLIPGTTEYKNAISELNNEVLSLVEKYPQLAKFLKFKNGQYFLEDEAGGRTQSDILEDLTGQQESYNNYLDSNRFSNLRNQYEKSNNQLEKQIADIMDDNNFKKVYYSDKSTEATIAAINELNNNRLLDDRLVQGWEEYDYYKTFTPNLDSHAIQNLTLEQLENLKDSLIQVNPNIESAINTIIDHKRSIEDNKASIDSLNSTLNRKQASDFGIESETGQIIWDNYLKNSGKAADATAAEISEIVRNNSKIQNGKYTSLNSYTEGKINLNADNLQGLNLALRELARNAGVELTNGVDSTEVEGIKKGADLLEVDDILTVDGQSMSIAEFREYAGQKIYDETIKTENSGVIANLQGKDSVAAIKKYYEGGGDIKNITDEVIGSLTYGQASSLGNYSYISENTGGSISVEDGYYNLIKRTLGVSEIPEEIEKNPLFYQFTISDWAIVKSALSENEAKTLEAFKSETKDSQKLLNYLNIIANSSAARDKYLGHLNVSSNFGKVYNQETGEWEIKTNPIKDDFTFDGMTLRSMAMNAKKQSLDYTKAIDDEIEKAYGVEKLTLLNQKSQILSDVSKTDRLLFYQMVNGSEGILDRTRFEFNGVTDRNALLDYINELEVDGSPYVEDAKNILAAFDQAQESAESTLDAKIEEYKYQYEILDIVKATIDQWRNLNKELKDWDKGISAFGKENLSNEYNYLKESLEIDYNYYLNRYSGKLTKMSGYINKWSVNNPYAGTNADGVNYISYEKLYSDYKEDIDGAVSSLEQMKTKVESLFGLWETGLKEIQESYDNIINANKDLTKILQGQIDLNKVVNNSNNLQNAYSNMIAYTEEDGILGDSKVQQLLKTYQMALQSGNEILIKSSKDALVAATTELSQWLDNRMKLLSQSFTDLTMDTVNRLLRESTGGQTTSLAALSLDWSLAQDSNERHLDQVNEVYALDQLNNRIQRSIDENKSSLIAQNKLIAKRAEIEEEITRLKREQGKLTQYDLDRANALYEVTLKQIALEEAQKTANTMKLTRDAMGNYSYQYVTDQDEIAAREDDVAAAENALYNLDVDRQNELVNNFFSLWDDYSEAIAKASATGDQELMNRVYDYYLGDNGLIKQNQKQIKDLTGNLTSEVPDILNAIIGMDLSDSAFETIFEDTQTKVLNTISTELPAINTTLDDIFAELKNNKYGVIEDGVDENGKVIYRGRTQDEYLNYIKGLDTNKIMGDVVTEVSKYMEQISDLEEALGTDMFNYVQNMMNRDATKANTDAIKNLTNATLDLIDTMDNNKLDGKIILPDGSYYTRDANGDKEDDGYWTFKANSSGTT